MDYVTLNAAHRSHIIRERLQSLEQEHLKIATAVRSPAMGSSTPADAVRLEELTHQIELLQGDLKKAEEESTKVLGT